MEFFKQYFPVFLSSSVSFEALFLQVVFRTNIADPVLSFVQIRSMRRLFRLVVSAVL